MTMPPIVIDNNSGKIIVELLDGDVIVAASNESSGVDQSSFMEWYQANHEVDETGIL